MKIKLIPGWEKKNLTCEFCKSKKSVKYKAKLITAKNYLEGEEICCCNKCALIYSANFVDY
jgi:hypothetical protein